MAQQHTGEFGIRKKMTVEGASLVETIEHSLHDGKVTLRAKNLKEIQSAITRCRHWRSNANNCSQTLPPIWSNFIPHNCSGVDEIQNTIGVHQRPVKDHAREAIPITYNLHWFQHRLIPLIFLLEWQVKGSSTKSPIPTLHSLIMAICVSLGRSDRLMK